jgi:cytidylate kinase
MQHPVAENSAGTKRQRPVIAIDGPAGAGKSTLAAHLARRFGFLNLETGAMYRALALKAIDSDISFDEETSLLELAENTGIKLEPQVDGNRVLLDVREQDVTTAASRVSVHPNLRAWMVLQQRALGGSGGVVMEGRDIGTAVFPDAEVKIFLDAAPEVRGNRRYRQVVPGVDHSPDSPFVHETQTPEQQKASEAAILRELKARDQRDRNRAESPLRPLTPSSSTPPP